MSSPTNHHELLSPLLHNVNQSTNYDSIPTHQYESSVSHCGPPGYTQAINDPFTTETTQPTPQITPELPPPSYNDSQQSQPQLSISPHIPHNLHVQQAHHLEQPHYINPHQQHAPQLNGFGIQCSAYSDNISEEHPFQHQQFKTPLQPQQLQSPYRGHQPYTQHPQQPHPVSQQQQSHNGFQPREQPCRKHLCANCREPYHLPGTTTTWRCKRCKTIQSVNGSECSII